MLPAPDRVHLATTVWGAAHVARWAAASLGSLLSPGNLPALAARGVETDVHVFTDAASAEQVRAAAAALAPLARVRLHRFEDTPYRDTPLARLVAGLDEGATKRVLNCLTADWMIDEALAAGGHAAIGLLDNDVLLADGALADAHAILAAGARGVMVPILRIRAEASEWVPAALGAGRGLGKRELCALLAGALHPVSAALDAASPTFSGYPTSVLWRVGEAGWLCRSFLPHPLLVRPVAGRWRPNCTVDYDYALAMHDGAEGLRLPAAGDRILALKRTPARVYVELAPRHPARLSASAMARFLFTHTHRSHGALARQAVRLAAAPGHDAAWAEAEARTATELERWYARVEAMQRDEPPGPALEILRRSHFGALADYLCPGRMAGALQREPSLARLLDGSGWRTG